MTQAAHAPVVLVVEDDDNLRLALADNLEEEGYRAMTAENLADARGIIASEELAVIVLDVMLPDGDGYALCRQLRDEGQAVPILMLTARTLEEDVVRGFDAGADDYVAKPYRLAELLARVRALLRRGRPNEAASLSFGGYRLELEQRRLLDESGAEVRLTRREFDLLAFFLNNQNLALTRQQLLEGVWGADVSVDTRTVDNFVSSLKRKLRWDGDATFQIRTVRGVGYRMEVLR